MLYTIRTLDKDSNEIYVDDVHGLKAAKARAVEMLADPETAHEAHKVEVLDICMTCVWDKFA